MAARDQLALILRSMTPDEVVPDDLTMEHIIDLVGADRILGRFALDIVLDLIAEHEDLHGKDGALDCERCTALEDIMRELEGCP